MDVSDMGLSRLKKKLMQSNGEEETKGPWLMCYGTDR